MVLSKQCILRPDVTWDQRELFHFCMLTSVIGKKVRRTKPKYIISSDGAASKVG